MARAFISGSHKDEARKDRRIAAREQTHIPRSLLTRICLVAAEDAERYLGRAIGRDEGGDAGAPGAIDEFARRAAKTEA